VLLLDAGDWDRAEEYMGSTVVNVSMNHWERPVWWLIRGAPPFRRHTELGGALKVARALGGGSAINKAGLSLILDDGWVHLLVFLNKSIFGYIKWTP